MIGHPLIGKLLRWDSDDGKFYTVSRFTDHLGRHLLLATRLCPREGTDLGVRHVVSLNMLAASGEGVEIFDDWQALERDRNSYLDRKPPLRLVQGFALDAGPSSQPTTSPPGGRQPI
jgi:hypothetical protein